MRKATPEQIAAARAEAVKRFGSPKLVAIPFAAPLDVEVIAAPFDRRGWSRFYDLSRSRPDDVADLMFLERALWPENIVELKDGSAAMPGELLRKLKQFAGETPNPPRLEVLTSAGAPAFGLSAEAAQGLLSDATTTLWLVLPARAFAGKKLCLVVETPETSRYEAVIDARDQAIRAQLGILEAGQDIMFEAFKWPASVDGLLEEWPGIAEDVVIAYARAGGIGLAGEAKSV